GGIMWVAGDIALLVAVLVAAAEWASRSMAAEMDLNAAPPAGDHYERGDHASWTPGGGRTSCRRSPAPPPADLAAGHAQLPVRRVADLRPLHRRLGPQPPEAGDDLHTLALHPLLGLRGVRAVRDLDRAQVDGAGDERVGRGPSRPCPRARGH